MNQVQLHLQSYPHSHILKIKDNDVVRRITMNQIQWKLTKLLHLHLKSMGKSREGKTIN